MRDLASGKESALTQSPEREFPAMTDDGTRVAYSVQDQKQKTTPIYVVGSGGGAPRKVCDDCGLVTAWTPDASGILYTAPGSPAGFGLLEVASGQKREFLRHPRQVVSFPKLSPDQKWVTFVAAQGSDQTRLVVAPVRGGAVAGEQEWVQILARSGVADWSPNGNVLYLQSAEPDGQPCIWAVRLDPETRRPVGRPSRSSTCIRGRYRSGT